MAGTAIVLRHKDRRIPAVVCVLLAVGIAIGGGVLIGGQSAGVVSAVGFDPGSLPPCQQQTGNYTLTFNVFYAEEYGLIEPITGMILRVLTPHPFDANVNGGVSDEIQVSDNSFKSVKVIQFPQDVPTLHPDLYFYLYPDEGWHHTSDIINLPKPPTFVIPIAQGCDENTLICEVDLPVYLCQDGNSLPNIPNCGFPATPTPMPTSTPVPGSCIEDQPEGSGLRLSERLNVTNPSQPDLDEAQDILLADLPTGGNCGAKLMFNLHLLDQQDLAIEILADAALVAGPWTPPETYRDDLRYDPNAAGRGYVEPYTRPSVACPHEQARESIFWEGITESECYEAYPAYVVGLSYITFTPELFVFKNYVTPITERPATADLFSTYIEESAHAWQLHSSGGIPEHPEIDLDATLAYARGNEHQAKVYFLELPVSILRLSNDAITIECNAFEPFNYADGVPDHEITAPVITFSDDSIVTWPNPDRIPPNPDKPKVWTLTKIEYEDISKCN